MKTLFIPAKSRVQINQSKIATLSKKLPKNIAIAYSIQYEDIAKQIKQIFSKDHKITKFTQVLGCSKPEFKNTKAILLISDGKFHATSIARNTNLPVFLLYNNKLEKISQDDIKKLEQKQKAAYLKYLHAEKIGILVSTKPGQQNLQKALQFKKQSDKNSYIFIANNLNAEEFENFPQIQSWVNTACPRMDLNNSKIINLAEIN